MAAMLIHWQGDVIISLSMLVRLKAFIFFQWQAHIVITSVWYDHGKDPYNESTFHWIGLFMVAVRQNNKRTGLSDR